MDSQMIETIREYFKTQPVEKAWIFGSFSRGEERPDSDVDLLVVFDHEHAKIGLMEYVRMMNSLSVLLNREVDLVEDGALLPAAAATAEQDKKLIYERVA